MEERERTDRVQATIRRVLPVLNVERAVLRQAFGVLDEVEFSEAMINSEVEPSLAFALHGRLAKALDDMEELAESLDEAASLAPGPGGPG